MFMLTAVTETAQLTTRTIRAMLILREEMDAVMKEILGTSFNYDLLKLLFTMPYLKIELLERTQLAHRQTAASWLKKLAAGNILSPQKMGRSTISAYMPEYQ
ncbi:MAG TPA: hypothetical protein VIR29_09420 [Anseongella sp.]